MLARFWGTRGSIAAPGPGTTRFGGNTSCVELTTPLRRRGGAGLRHRRAIIGQPLAGLGVRPHCRHHSANTSPLGPHPGLPVFRAAVRAQKPFQGLRAGRRHLSLRDVLAGQMEHQYFPVELDQLAARISYEDLSEGTYDIAGVEVRAQQMNHPSPTLGYRIEAEGRSICYLCDHEPYSREDLAGGRPPGKSRIDSRSQGDRRHAEYMRGADRGNSRIAVHTTRIPVQAALGP